MGETECMAKIPMQLSAIQSRINDLEWSRANDVANAGIIAPRTVQTEEFSAKLGSLELGIHKLCGSHGDLVTAVETCAKDLDAVRSLFRRVAGPADTNRPAADPSCQHPWKTCRCNIASL